MTEQLPAGSALVRERPAGGGRLWFVVLLLAAVAAFALYQSPLLRLQSLEVKGNEHLSRERLIEVAGLYPGSPRWELTATRVATRLKQEPWVKTARAEWTGNRLLVEVTERTPVSLLPYQSKWVALDASGIILELVDSPAKMRLPVISGVAAGSGLRGRQLPHPGLSDALLVLSAMVDSFRNQVAEVNVDSDRSLTLVMVGGAWVQWGQVSDGKDRAQSVNLKLQAFSSFWQKVSRQKLSSCRIDLRVNGRVIPSGCE